MQRRIHTLLFILISCCVYPCTSLAQIAVKNHQRLSATEGGLNLNLDSTARWGSTITNIGDFNKDGIPDIAVGSPRANDGGVNRGAIYLLFLNSDGTVKQYKKISDTTGNFTGGLADYDAFGSTITNLGDLNKDGIIDLAVGAPRDDDAGSQSGSVWILMLDSSGEVKQHNKLGSGFGNFSGTLNEGDVFGNALANIGDLDNNGTNDLAIGAENHHTSTSGGVVYGQKGAVWVVRLDTNGNSIGEYKITDTVSNFFQPLENNARFGISITSLGDLDNDGIPDIAVGSPKDDDGGTNRGAVYILFLETDGSIKTTRKISYGGNNLWAPIADFDNFGYSVSSIGDLDNNGTNDLVVGAPRDDDGGSRSGSIWILLLDESWRVKAYDKIANGYSGFSGTLKEGDLWGSAITNLGDLDQDGYDDIAVSAEVSPASMDGGIIHSQKGAVWVLQLSLPTLGLGDQLRFNSLTLYPNPSTEQLLVEVPSNQETLDEITVINKIGQIFPVKVIEESSSSLTLNISELPSGQYFIRTTSKQSIYFGKFIKL